MNWNWDTLELGTCPVMEAAVQVSPNADYLPAMREQCNRYRELLKIKFGEPPEGASLTIKRNKHDFGPYLEVAVRFDPENELARTYAYFLEEHQPDYWAETNQINWKPAPQQQHIAEDAWVDQYMEDRLSGQSGFNAEIEVY